VERAVEISTTRSSTFEHFSSHNNKKKSIQTLK
jgi:hypothetical protein